MFGDVAPDTDQQLLAGEGQWIFTVEGKKYYLPSSKRHFPLLLPIGNGAAEDDMFGDSVHRFCSCRDFNAQWL